MTAIWHTIVSGVERLSTARPECLAGALALYVVSLFIVGARWRTFLRAVGGEVGVVRATLATLGGISVANLTPSSRLGGEACRIALVQSAGRVTWRQATIAAVWDRLSEVPPVVVLAVMALVAARDLTSRWRGLVVGVAFGLLMVALVLGIRALRRSEGAPARWRARLALDRVSGWVYAGGVGYSCLLWLQDILRLSLAALAFGVVLSPTRVAVLSILTMLGGLVPTLGGLGAVEGGLMAGLSILGVDLATAAAITAAERAISYGFSTAAGAIVIALLGGRSLWQSVRHSPSLVQQALENGNPLPPAG